MAHRWWMVLPIVFLAYLIGMFNLYDGIVSQAEVNSLRHIAEHHQPDTRSVPEILESIVRLSPQHAPLYFLILRYWYEAFGSDPGMIRLLSIFFGMLTVASVYRLGVTLTDHRVGWYASAWLISSWAFMYYTHEIRQYAFLLFVSSILIWVYWRIVHYKRHVPLGYWLLLFATSVMSVYIHYFGILSLIGIGIYHVLFAHKSRRWLMIALVEVVAGLCFLPWLSIMLRGMRTMPDLTNRALPPLDVIYQLLFFHSNGLWFILLGLIIWMLWQFRKLHKAERFAVIILLTMVSAIFVIHQVRPILFEERLRYVIIFLPMVSVVVGISIRRSGRWERYAALLISGVFVAGLVFVQQDILHDYAGLDRTPPYDEILTEMDDLQGMFEPLVSLSSRADNTVVSMQVRDYYSKLTGRKILHFNDRKSPERFANDFEKIAEDDIGFWLLFWSDAFTLNEMTTYRDLIARDFQNCRMFSHIGNLQLYFMARPDVPCDVVSLDTPLVTYDNGVRLSYVWTEVNEDILHVYVWWDDIMFETYGASLQVFDSNNEKVVQDDFVVVEGLHHRQLAWDDSFVGDFNIQMILYTLDDVSSIGGLYQPDETYFDRSFIADTISIGG